MIVLSKTKAACHCTFYVSSKSNKNKKYLQENKKYMRETGQLFYEANSRRK